MVLQAGEGGGGARLYIKITFAKSEEEKTGCNLAEFCKEGCG
jgi:hypothetical protein